MNQTLLAFAASNSTSSINKAFALHAADVFASEIAPGTKIETLDLNDFEMPIYSPEREKAGGIPVQAHAFYEKLGAADGLIISFAEHNGTYTAAFKNLFDWTSRIDQRIYQETPAVFLALSPGGRAGQGVLGAALMAAPHFGALIHGSLGVGPYREHVDPETGALVTEEKKAALREALGALSEAMANSSTKDAKAA